jgi:acetyl-CoA acyltransferase
MGRAHKGTLKDTRPDSLLAQVMNGVLAKLPAVKPGDLEDLIVGCAFPEAEQGFNVARNAVFLAKWPDTVPAVTVNRFCSSGLQAVAQGAERIAFGSVDLLMTGGLESMTMVPMTGNKFSANPELVDMNVNAYIPMGLTAERVAKRFEVTRQQQDQFALRSHQRAVAAIKEGKFKDEIVPVQAIKYVEDGTGIKQTTVSFDTDELPRPDTSLEGLAKLKPAFMEGGTVTAGNSSPLTDGASAVVLASKDKAQALGLKPLAVFRGFAVAGVAPDIMGIGPVPAIRKLLEKHKLSVKDIDLFEINEAFASQAVYCARELGISDDKLNVNGGAIALGHALGSTGARMTATLLSEMGRRKSRYGIVSMCIGGGQGAAALYERI